MATSDSEDFESADEEFELTQSLKHKEDEKKIFSKENVCEKKSSSEPTASDKDDPKTLLNTIENKLSSETLVINKNLVKDGNNEKEIVMEKQTNATSAISVSKETSKSETVKSSNRRMTNLEKQAKKSEAKQKSGSKKLGMKLSNVNEDTEKSKELSTSDIGVQLPNISNKATSDPKTTKLLETTVESRPIDDTVLESQQESNFKPDVISESTSTTKVVVLEEHSRSKFEPSKESSPDINSISKSASGDGWEVEEEDGFEVPVSLSNKPKSEIVQSEREISPVLERLSAVASQGESKGQGWGSWGGWGVTSLLSTATESVSTFSSHVTSGISTVLESGLGAPDPEELAKHVAQEEKEKESNTKPDDLTKPAEGTDKTEGLGFSGLGSLMSLSTKVLSGGLDTLETLGKKTMEVLQEGDPMLRKKRAMLFHDPDKPVLSQILKEAKEKAENDDKELAEKEATRKAHFETLFDDYQGLVHLEALEMLSKQCTLKLQSILLSYSGEALVDLQETLSEVKDLCEIPEDEDEEQILTKEEFENKITECMKSLHVNLTSSKIIQVYDTIDNQLKEMGVEKIPAVDIHQRAISSMAEFTSCAMECFHKGAELVLTKSHRSTADEAENFVVLTTTFCSQVSSLARDFTYLLTKWDPIANSSYITNIFLEAGNSASYIQNACLLLLPVVQIGAVS